MTALLLAALAVVLLAALLLRKHLRRTTSPSTPAVAAPPSAQPTPEHFVYLDGCSRCFIDRQIQPPHHGDHVVQLVSGGRASCPDDEYDDETIREEMLWVSLEAALEDAGVALVDETSLAAAVLARLGSDPSQSLPLHYDLRTIGQRMRHDGCQITWTARTDDHLDTFGTVDVVCTIRSEPMRVPVAA